MALGNRPADQRPAALDPERRERLQKMFGLSDDEMNEVAAESYTLLDGWRLDEAFLLRDAATHVLEPEEEGGDLPPYRLWNGRRPPSPGRCARCE